MNNEQILAELKKIKKAMSNAEIIKGQFMLRDLIEKLEKEQGGK